jgi:hypothetical protein
MFPAGMKNEHLIGRRGYLLRIQKHGQKTICPMGKESRYHHAVHVQKNRPQNNIQNEKELRFLNPFH